MDGLLHAFKNKLKNRARQETDMLVSPVSSMDSYQRALQAGMKSPLPADIHLTSRPGTGQRAVQDVQARAQVETSSPTPDPEQALALVRQYKPEYQGTDQEFYELYKKHGGRLLEEIPQARGGAAPVASTTRTTNLPDAPIAGVPKQYLPLIQQAAKQYGVPVSLLSALIKQESGFNPNARSYAGALGIAQFMPATAKGYGIDPLDPNQAIPAAAKYLAGNFKNFGSWELALAAYNAGGGNVGKYGGIPPFPETQNYVKNVMAMANAAGGGQYGY